MRRLAFTALMAAVCIGSFFTTLWVLDGQQPADNRPGSEQFMSHRISNRSEVVTAASASGLRFSRRLKGNVDLIRRINDREVLITGWVADPGGDETPLTVYVFVDGPAVATVHTKDERPDVTAAIKLGFGAEKNVAFQATFDCKSGDQPIVVALGTADQYAILGSPNCP